MFINKSIEFFTKKTTMKNNTRINFIQRNKGMVILSCLLSLWQGQLQANGFATAGIESETQSISANAKHAVTAKQAKALAVISKEVQLNEQSEKHLPIQKQVIAKITELTDNTGLVYLGAVVNKADLSPYLTQLAKHLGSEYKHYRQQQAKRDHQQFHMTLINPYEYQTIDTNKRMNTKNLKVTLLGLGKVSSGEKTTYYIVAQSDDGQLFRQKLVLKPKDFHVTLGFNPQDVYGVSKGIETLLP